MLFIVISVFTALIDIQVFRNYEKAIADNYSDLTEDEKKLLEILTQAEIKYFRDIVNQ